MSLSRRLVHLSSRALYAVFAVGVAHYAVQLLYHSTDITGRFAANFAALRTLAVPGHFFFAALALALTPLQLSAFVRLRWPRVHRLAGLLYVAAVLIAGVSALRLAPAAQYGWVARSGFLTLGVLWIAITLYALHCVLARDFDAHARWMTRSIALTSAAITLRLILGLGVHLGGLPMALVYPATAWACWLINLAVCEALLARTSYRRWGSFPRTA